MLTKLAAQSTAPRRVLATRNTGWAIRLTHTLAGCGVRPNTVSISGVTFALVSSAAFFGSSTVEGPRRVTLLLLAAGCIQLRLLCNLLDGMLAVEGGLGSRTGEIFNELPDRLADMVILVGAGYAVQAVPYGPVLGWAAAVAALFTAYVRVLGGSIGVTQHFVGPMAKQHRMFTMTVAAVLSAAEVLVHMPPRAMPAGLVVVIAGSLLTAFRRIRRIVDEVNSQ